jgi:hypothetical protein
MKTEAHILDNEWIDPDLGRIRRKPMRLVDTKTIGDGLAFLTYQFVRDA